jgi:RimK family alpha-L-glutamate ligase
MKITILTTEKRFNCYENQRFKTEAKAINIKLNITLPEYYEVILDSEHKSKIFYQEKEIKLPDAFIPRNTALYFSRMIARQFENKQVYVLNNAYASMSAKDKLLTLQNLSHANIPIPKSILAKYPLNINFIKKNLKFPLLVKKTESSLGKGIIMCNDHHQLQDFFDLLADSFVITNNNLIIQEFISEKIGQDIRVIVIGEQAIGAMLRTSRPGGFKSNYSAGGTIEKYPLTPELAELAVKATKSLGLNMAGVDILFDKDSYKICEVNFSPYFEGFEKATGINVPQEVFKFILQKLAERKR